MRCNHGRILGTGALLPRQLPQPQDLLPRTCQRATSLSREPLREHHAGKKRRSQIVVLRSALCVRLRNCSLSRAGRRQLGSGGRISFRGCFCPSSNGDQVVHAWLLRVRNGKERKDKGETGTGHLARQLVWLGSNKGIKKRKRLTPLRTDHRATPSKDFPMTTRTSLLQGPRNAWQELRKTIAAQLCQSNESTRDRARLIEQTRIQTHRQASLIMLRWSCPADNKKTQIAPRRGRASRAHFKTKSKHLRGSCNSLSLLLSTPTVDCSRWSLFRRE